MDTYISARSPIVRYTPCLDCIVNGGWQVAASPGDGIRGIDGRLAVAFNFTGTGLAFNFTALPPPTWTPTLLINGSAPPTTRLNNTSDSQQSSPYSVERLPLGQHSIDLIFVPPPPDPFSTAPVAPFTISGITADLGLISTASTRNATIDDTAWRNETVVLTPGWNMLESGLPGAVDNWINTTQMEAERSVRNMYWNQSASWTEQRRAAVTIRMVGDAAWVWGTAGGEAGRYEVEVDGQSRGAFDAAGGGKVYNQLLYHTSSLGRGEHNITLRNLDQGRRLTVDRVDTISALPTAAPSPLPSPSPSQATTPSGSTGSLSGGAVAGIVIGTLLFALLVALLAIFLWGRRKRNSAVEDKGTISEPKTFFQWPNRSQHNNSWFKLPERGITSAADHGDMTMTGARRTDSRTFRLPQAFRKSGAWSFSNANSERSFMTGLESPSSSRRAAAHAHGIHSPGAGSGSSFLHFSRTPKKPKLSISHPMTIAGGGGQDELMTPAMAAAVAGRTMSPLAAFGSTMEMTGTGHDVGHAGGADIKVDNSKLAPVSLGRAGEGQRMSADTVGQIFSGYADASATTAWGESGQDRQDAKRLEKWEYPEHDSRMGRAI